MDRMPYLCHLRHHHHYCLNTLILHISVKTWVFSPFLRLCLFSPHQNGFFGREDFKGFGDNFQRRKNATPSIRTKRWQSWKTIPRFNFLLDIELLFSAKPTLSSQQFWTSSLLLSQLDNELLLFSTKPILSSQLFWTSSPLSRLKWSGEQE